MNYVVHAVNTIEKLNKVSKNFGIEVDIRLQNNSLVLGHDLANQNENFENFLKNYNHSLIVANIKQSGIENLVIDTLKLFNIKNYFLLDIEFPFIFKNFKNIGEKLSLRFSEFESEFQNEELIKLVKWLWIDSFTKVPIDQDTIKYFKKFETCLVSPSRWGRKDEIKSTIDNFNKFVYTPDWIMVELEEVKIWARCLNKNQ